MKETGPLCAPVPAMPPAPAGFHGVLSFVPEASDIRARHYICPKKTISPIRRFCEVFVGNPDVIQKWASRESQSQTMRLRSLERGGFEIGTMLA